MCHRNHLESIYSGYTNGKDLPAAEGLQFSQLKLVFSPHFCPKALVLAKQIGEEYYKYINRFRTECLTKYRSHIKENHGPCN